ncbi:MAG: helix-turn-helix domain-containing protein [Clostridiales bacterium]|nr:helix-turn-helix domain-containing protein [Clostridiales bacterium]
MNRIKDLRRARGITQDELGRLLGVQKAAVCKYENEKVGIPQAVLSKLTDIFGVTADHILCRDEAAPLPKGLRDRIRGGAPVMDAVSVPLVGMVHAGEPMLAEENIEDYIPVAAGEVYDGDYFFMEVVGDCMTGDHIAEGAIVLVRKTSDLRDGYIYVIRMGDEVLLRRVKRIKKSIALIPSNPAYDPMIVTGGDMEVIGRVVESRLRH